MRITYKTQAFRADALATIDRANEICEQYAADGYDLTLRQLYYQFVSRAWLANTQAEYKRLGSVVNDARIAGLIDWDHLTDRTRNLASLPTWRDPQQILHAVAIQYREDLWDQQPEYLEIWVEKEALAGVIARPANRWRVPYFSCRGYVSQSEMHEAARRIRAHARLGKQKCTIVHLGDHDPSGLDMTRDIRDRMELFGAAVTVNRIALNMDQVEQYQPPPNPAKITDPRAADYIEQYGGESWELDALDPTTLDALVDGEIQRHLNHLIWDRSKDGEDERRVSLSATSDRWGDVAAFLTDDDE